MSDAEALANFIAKWRTRWPEWRVVEALVPEAQHETALAWFALRQELTEAAWGGEDARPGEAKLAWWAEELQGWSQGRRRHPLGLALQRLPAPWQLLATCLPALRASRERQADAAQATDILEPFAEALAGIGATLFAGDTPAPAVGAVVGVLAEQVLQRGDPAAPLHALARLGEAEPDTAARDWAGELLRGWPLPHEGSRPGRIHAALVRARLRRFASGRHRGAPLPYWIALFVAWRAARG